MSISPFEFEGQKLRFVGEEVVATDLAKALGYASAKDMTRTLDDDEKGGQIVPTLGGDQYLTTVTESGFYRACLNRQAGYVKDPEARDFIKRLQRWVSAEVLPSIRKTGTYSVAPALTEDQIVHQALQITAKRVEQLETEVRQLTPKAASFDHFLSAVGDYSVAQAAQMLVRSGATTGRNRLFGDMERFGWTYKPEGSKSWRAYQRAVDPGYLVVRAGKYEDANTGVVHPTTTIRITPKGLFKLAEKFGVVLTEEHTNDAA